MITELTPTQSAKGPSTIIIDVDLKRDLRRIAVARDSNLSAEIAEACRRYVVEYRKGLEE